MDDDSPSTSSSTNAQQQGNDLYCTHKVDMQLSVCLVTMLPFPPKGSCTSGCCSMQITKLDTLAGVAVKYNVSVCLSVRPYIVVAENIV